MIGIVLQHRPALPDFVGHAVQSGVYAQQEKMRFYVVWINDGEVLEMLGRLLVLAEIHQRLTQHCFGTDAVGVQLHGSLQRRYSLSPLFALRIASTHDE